MPRFSSIKNTFKRGELSPRLYGRTDTEEVYQNGLLRCKNAIPGNLGGLSRRPGSVFVKDITTLGTAAGDGAWEQEFDLSTATYKSRLFPFEFEAQETYLFVAAGRVGGRAASADLTLADSKTFQAFGDEHVVNVAKPGATITYGVPAYRGASSLYSAFLDDLNSTSGTSFTIGDYTGADATSFLHPAGLTEDYDGAQLREIQNLQINDLLFLVHRDHPPLILKRNSANNFTELSHRELASIPSNAAFSGTAAEEWMAQWYLGVPYRDPVVTPGAQPTLSVNTTGNAGTISTSVAITNAASWGGLQAGHVGSVFIGTHGATTGAILITQVTSTTAARGIVLKAFGATTATDNWRESSWNDVRGWPRSVAYYNGRVIYGGNVSQPSTIWATQAFDIGQLAPASLFDGISAASSDPYQVTISTTESANIQWIIPQKQLLIGTTTSELFATEAVSGSITTLSVTTETNYGSSYRQPVMANNNAIFVDRTGNSIREFAFNFQDDAFKADNLSTYADHLPHMAGYSPDDSFLYGAIDEVALQRAPMTIVWFLNPNGGLFGVTRNSLQGVVGWHQHLLGGSGWSSDPHAKVESIASMKHYSEEEIDQTGPHRAMINKEALFMGVRRMTGASTNKVYIERLNRDYWNPRLYTDIDNDFRATTPSTEHLKGNIDLVFMDSAIEVDGTGGVSSTITGLSHLEGRTVRVYADGRDIGSFTVASNEIDASAEITDFSYAIVGAPYDTEIITLPIEVGSFAGQAQGDIKRIHDIILKFHLSGGVTVGQVRDDVIDATPSTDATDVASRWETISYEDTTLALDRIRLINFNPPTMPSERATPLFSGTKVVTPGNGFDRDGRVLIKNSSVFPMFLNYIVVRGDSNER